MKVLSMTRFFLILACVVCTLPACAATPDQEETYTLLNLFGDVFERARANYVDETTDKQLVEAAMNGMLTALDPHSGYLDAKEFKEMRTETSGAFGGLGIQVTMDKGLVKVIAPIDETPAARAGIKTGDFIVEIDGAPVMGLTLTEAVDKMRGKVGTDVSLRVAREGTEKPLVFALKREIIPIHSVRARTEGKVGYIRITQFNEKTTEDLDKAMKDLDKDLKGGAIGYVLDLRSNPGGVLDAAIGVSDAFLDSGEIVSTRGRDKTSSTRDMATKGDVARGLPIVVLIDAGSASAAEIVAGALQDQGRAVLMGTRSFGKGSVQTIIPLPNEGAMRLTTARYYTPSGRSIQAKGIDPDIVVEPAKVELLEGIDWREADLKGALVNPDKTATTEKKKPSTKEEEEAKAAKADYQLARALDLLQGLSVYNPKGRDAPKIKNAKGL